MGNDQHMSIVPVRIDNIDEFREAAVRTQEEEAQHFTCSTFTLPAGEIIGLGVQATQPTPILQLDPLRKRAVLTFNGTGTGQVILAHSLQQATSLAQNIQQAADEGALVTCPTTVTVESTAALWAVPVGYTAPLAASTITYGKATPTTTFSGIASTPALPPGEYTVLVTTYLDGTVVTADDEDNFRIVVSGTVLTGNIIQPGPSSGLAQAMVTGPFTVILAQGASDVISVQTDGVAPSGTAVYHAQIVATPVSLASQVNGLSVGVVQERRDHT